MNDRHGSDAQSNRTARAKQLRGVLQPDKTLPASLIAGSKAKYTLILLFAVFSQVRWDDLYSKSWYRAFVDFMTSIYPTIAKIPSTPSQFPEYAMALLAFCNAIGPFFVVFYLVYGLIHVKSIDLEVISGMRMGKKVILVVFSIASFLLFVTAPFVWTGHSFHLPTLFYESKSAFLAMTLIIWVVMCVSALMAGGFPTSVIMSRRHR
jgi:hypothetical protein